MKKVKYIKDYITQFNLPKGIWGREYKRGEVLFPKGTIRIVNEDEAKRLCRKIVDWNYYDKTGKIKYTNAFAKVIKDLGIHIGTSKHTYIKNGRSKVYG